ncbi:MAG: hypothetical protein HYZ49_17055 [Chloroflexi bacterium]|nr:hypothetical protein [Chloroflexota bacterium]
MQKLQQSPAQKYGRGCLALFALVWTGFSCFACIVPLSISLVSLTSGSIEDVATVLLSTVGPALFTLPFLVIGVGLLAYAVWPWIARARVSAPDIAISNSTPRPGEELTLVYTQTFKAATEVKRIAFQLIFRETATYQRGTDTVTVHHDNLIQEFEIPARRFEAGETFRDQRRLQIPPEAMHTFLAPRNKLQWFLKAKVEMAGWPDFNEDYPITVLAERA